MIWFGVVGFVVCVVGYAIDVCIVLLCFLYFGFLAVVFVDVVGDVVVCFELCGVEFLVIFDFFDELFVCLFGFVGIMFVYMFLCFGVGVVESLRG